MGSMRDYQLFLFDFDGLLVNTEELHYLAYKQMCQQFGVELDWSFERYCCAAHYDSDAVRNQLYGQYPELYQREPNWDILYAEKKRRVIALLEQGTTLMPGAEEILTHLQENGIKRCVVTHSAEELVAVARAQHPILNTIPHWITRHDYSHPKPQPDCYLKAIEKLADPNDRIVGFEDTPRGIKALSQTRAQPVLICKVSYPEIPEFVSNGILCYPTISAFLE
jgi:beta-phosphoglucomutase